MPKFNPNDFDYHIVRDEENIIHYQRKNVPEQLAIIDVLEFGYYKKENIWQLFIEVQNLKQFLPIQFHMMETYKIHLFIGRIKNNQDFRFLKNKILKDPKLLIQIPT